jgi:hypothetical protein
MDDRYRVIIYAGGAIGEKQQKKIHFMSITHLLPGKIKQLS